MKNSHFWILVVAMTALMCVVDMALIPVLIGPTPTAEICRSGDLLHSLSLDEDNQLTVDAPGGGSNTIFVKDGRICITHSSCPDQECVRKGWIDKAGDSISCAANGLTIELKEPAPDADKSAE